MVFHVSAVNLINYVLLSAGLGVCVMCLLHISTAAVVQKEFKDRFKLIFILLFIYISTHLARRIIEGLPGAGVHVAMIILPLAEITTAGLMTFFISLLLISLYEGKQKKNLTILFWVLLAVNIALLLYGTASGTYYYIDSENLYNRGSLYLLANLVPTIMLCIDMVILILRGKMITGRIVFAFWVYMIAPLIAMVLQSLSYGIQYIIVATVAGSVFMYFSIAKAQARLFEKQNASISRMQNGLILVMADLVESRDQCTGDHVRKTAEYTRIIMEQMKKDGSYVDQLTDEFIEDVVRSAPLHDIGKIHVSDVILNKPGKLTPEEFEEIKLHTTAGRDIITSAIDMVSEDSTGYLNEARNLAYCHHEKWNGKGYPQGLSNEDIPLSARIMAVADVFDALISKRSYKDEFSFEKAMEIIREGVGTHFDPKVAEAFLRAEAEVRAVAYSDPEAK